MCKLRLHRDFTYFMEKDLRAELATCICFSINLICRKSKLHQCTELYKIFKYFQNGNKICEQIEILKPIINNLFYEALRENNNILFKKQKKNINYLFSSKFFIFFFYIYIFFFFFKVFNFFNTRNFSNHPSQKIFFIHQKNIKKYRIPTLFKTSFDVFCIWYECLKDVSYHIS